VVIDATTEGSASLSSRRGRAAEAIAADDVNKVQDRQTTVPGWVVVPLRLYLGCAFLSAASNKVGPGKWGHWPEWMGDFIQTQLQQAAGFYRPILTAVILPHTGFFAPFVAIMEIAVGVALIVGGATRLAAALGILLTLNYFLLDGMSVIDVSNDAAFIVTLAVVLVTAAGRTAGLDAVFARRWPRVWLW
jgi:uncharacterized membrane protein YphA (DoxX/SURF4 family)